MGNNGAVWANEGWTIAVPIAGMRAPVRPRRGADRRVRQHLVPATMQVAAG